MKQAREAALPSRLLPLVLLFCGVGLVGAVSHWVVRQGLIVPNVRNGGIREQQRTGQKRTTCFSCSLPRTPCPNQPTHASFATTTCHQAEELVFKPQNPSNGALLAEFLAHEQLLESYRNQTLKLHTAAKRLIGWTKVRA